MRRDLTETVQSWSGLFGGAGAWFASQQAGAWKVLPQCADHGLWVVAINVVALAVALGAATLSWRVRHVPDTSEMRAERMNFIAVMCAGIAVLCTLAIVLQGLAGVVFQGCER